MGFCGVISGTDGYCQVLRGYSQALIVTVKYCGVLSGTDGYW